MLAFSKYLVDTKTIEQSKTLCHFTEFQIKKTNLVKTIRCRVTPSYEVEWGVQYKDAKTIANFYMKEYVKGTAYNVEPYMVKGLPSIGKTLGLLIENRLTRLREYKEVTTKNFYYMVLLTQDLEGYLDNTNSDYTIKGKDKAGKFSVLDINIPNFTHGNYMTVELRNLSKEQILQYSAGFNVKIKGKPHGVLRTDEVLSLLQSLRSKIE